MKNSKLAIAIPTYNRAEILKENLLYMLEDIKKYNIPIYISDDSTNNDTKNMIAKIKNQYANIYYFHNGSSLGHDKNCFYTLNLPDEDYIWYLGDSIIIENGTISMILEIINKYKLDLIFINEETRNLDVKSGVMEDKNRVLLDLGWHLTLSGTTIYSKKNLYNIENIELTKVKNFPQFALIFKILNNSNKVYWINDKKIFSNPQKKSYWNERVFETFISDWENVVASLSGNYEKNAISQCIINHSKYTELFGFESLLKMRSDNIFNKKKLNIYKDKLKMHSILPGGIQFLISRIPISFFELKKKFKKMKLFFRKIYFLRKSVELYNLFINLEKSTKFENNIIKQINYSSKINDTVCIFAHYDEQNIIEEYVVYYLKKLKEKNIDLVFVSTAEEINENEIDKIKDICLKVIIKKNIGYDFGSWACAIVEMKNCIKEYKKLILANDSVYAPLFDLDDFFSSMNKKNLDFYGITDTYIFTHHIQSYFMCFNERIINSEVFFNFWENYKVYRNKFNIVYHNEVRLTTLLSLNGFSFDVYCPVRKVTNFPYYNTTHYFWRELIEIHQCPILKIELIKKNPLKLNNKGWRSILQKHTQYNISLIEKHLSRVKNESI